MPMVLLETEWDAVVVVVRVAFAQFILRKEYGDFFSNIDNLYFISYTIVIVQKLFFSFCLKYKILDP